MFNGRQLNRNPYQWGLIRKLKWIIGTMYKEDIDYLDNTGICLLIDSSSEISVSVRTIPAIF